MPELKLYTIGQLRDWVMHNNEVDGLSEKIISRTRAYALVNNPYVWDEDAVVAAIFVDGEDAAYVTAFPEMIDDQRYWWFSALWCNPKYQGNGYGLIVVGSLAEVYGTGYCIDKWGAKETVEIFTYLGHHTVYIHRYVLGVKVDQTTFKGKCVHLFRTMQTNLHRTIEKYSKERYTLRYIPYIDDVSYEFIKKHSGNYYFLHTQEFMNWVLQYPLTISAPLLDKVDNKMPFSESEILSSQLFAVQVYADNQMVGFYILKQKGNSLNVVYLYYDELHKNQVFASIRDHIKSMHISQCATEHKELGEYLSRHIYFPKRRIEQVSFSTMNLKLPKADQLQLGDGDGFV